jgi:hypothetical protein
MPVKRSGSGLAKSHLCHNHNMARPLRIELAGGLYHVTSRGDRREDIYLGDADREAWLAVFAQKLLAKHRPSCKSATVARLRSTRQHSKCV